MSMGSNSDEAHGAHAPLGMPLRRVHQFSDGLRLDSAIDYRCLPVVKTEDRIPIEKPLHLQRSFPPRWIQDATAAAQRLLHDAAFIAHHRRGL